MVESLDHCTLAKEIIEGKLRQQVNNVITENTFFTQKNFSIIDLNQVYAFMENIVIHFM